MTKMIRKMSLYFLGALSLALSNCKKEEVKKEEARETITKVVLTFTDEAKNVVTTTAEDPDGDGVKPMETGTIQLAPNKTYTLTIKLYNGLVKETDEGYDQTVEITEKAKEHQFFFAWTSGLFSNPAGDGNMDNRSDPLNYNDKDGNGLPLGLSTTWTTGVDATGFWQFVLKHQPALKSAATTSKDGETDMDIRFPITIKK